LAQVDAREATDTAYLLGNGQGKSRMTRSIGVRKKLTWTLLCVSAGELTLAEHAASVGKRAKGGAEIRLLFVAVRAEDAMLSLEDIANRILEQEGEGRR